MPGIKFRRCPTPRSLKCSSLPAPPPLPQRCSLPPERPLCGSFREWVPFVVASESQEAAAVCRCGRRGVQAEGLASAKALGHSWGERRARRGDPVGDVGPVSQRKGFGCFPMWPGQSFQVGGWVGVRMSVFWFVFYKNTVENGFRDLSGAGRPSR